jgi:hypothetical protein
MTLLKTTWDSTEALYHRFGLNAETTPPVARRQFLVEETRELIEASTLSTANFEADEHQIEVIREAADVVVTALGLVQAHGISFDQFAYEMLAKVRGNDAKTPDTHEVRDGKIRRRK